MVVRRYRHLIWDWNGTLLDDLDLCVDVINGVLARRGHAPIDRARYHDIFDFPVRLFYERLGLPLHDGEFEKLSHEFISGFHSRRLETRLHEGAGPLLQSVADAGVSQSILSAHQQTTLLEVLDHFGVRAHFAQIAGLDDFHAHSKIARGRELLDLLGDPPDTMLLVGDTLHDLEVARALGVDCVVVAAGHHPIHRLRGEAPVVVETLAHLREHLGLAV